MDKLECVPEKSYAKLPGLRSEEEVVLENNQAKSW